MQNNLVRGPYVILNEATGGVKDLEYHIGPPHWQPPVIQLLSYAQRRQSGNVSAHILLQVIPHPVYRRNYIVGCSPYR